MTPETKPPAVHPTFEQKAVHILIRWLVIALAFHFLALSGIRPEEFSLAIEITSLLILSNLLLMFAPERLFAPGRFFYGLIALDFGFIAVSLYFLREPSAYYHWVYMGLLGLFIWRGNLREALIALIAGLVLSGAASYLLQGAWQISSDTGDFLRMTMLLAVGVFYFLVLDLLVRNSRLFHIVARAKEQWERTADAMSEWILLVDAEERIHRINRPLAAQLGKTPRELAGQRWYAVLDGSPAPPSDSPLTRMFQSQTPVEARYAHASLRCETQTLALPLFEGSTLAGGIYVLRPLKNPKND